MPKTDDPTTERRAPAIKDIAAHPTTGQCPWCVHYARDPGICSVPLRISHLEGAKPEARGLVVALLMKLALLGECDITLDAPQLAPLNADTEPS